MALSQSWTDGLISEELFGSTSLIIKVLKDLDMKKKPTIIPIASGKGGVGKSMLAANLAIALAEKNKKITAVDLDLGGSNLYTFLGVPNKYPGIGDFLKTDTSSIASLVMPTGTPNLSFLPGDGTAPFTANITYEQRNRIIQEIKTLEADYILLDLGAGTVFNTLNFYGISYRSVIVTTTETPAVMNFVMFLRNFIFRVISGLSRQDKQVFNTVVRAFQQPTNAEPLSVKRLMDMIRPINSSLSAKIEKVCSAYQPRLIFNMIDHPNEMKVVPKIDNTLKNGLSITPAYLSALFYDEAVRKAAKERTVVINRYPESHVAGSIRNIADQIIENWHDPLHGNDMKNLIDHTKVQYQEYRKIWH